MLPDEPEIEEEEGEEYEPRNFLVCEGDVFVPDSDLLAEAMDKLGVVPLAYQSRDGQIYVLIACSAGFKWADIESIGKSERPKLRPVQ